MWGFFDFMCYFINFVNIILSKSRYERKYS